MQRRHVVRRVRDAGRRQRLGDAGAFGGAHDVHVVDVPRFVLGKRAELAEPELGVACGGLAARAVPAVELAQEEPQRGSLDLVEARVRPDVGEALLVLRAVKAEHPNAVRQVLVRRRDEPAVAEREQVLRREEAEGRGDADGGDASGAEGLRRVLDDRDAEPG